MRILLLTQWFDPEPTFKGLAFAHELRARGHDVSVITGFPNYPGGRVYAGYQRRFRTVEDVDGIRVVRAWLHPSHDRSRIGRVANYVSFAASAVLAGSAVERPDVIYAYHPPGTTGVAAAVLGRLWGSPFVLDVQDLWPDTLAATGMLSNERVLGGVGRVMARVYREAAHVVVLSQGFRDRLIGRGVPADRVTVIHNWCDERHIRPAETWHVSSATGGDGTFTVMFAGTMGAAQRLETVLEAARMCLSAAPHVRFVFVGGGIDRSRLVAAAEEGGLTNVRFVDPQPMERMGPILASADALLVHLRDDPLFAVTVPSKTQAYLASGKPIIMAVRGDAARLVESAGAGATIPPDDPAALTEAIVTLSNTARSDLIAMGERGRRFYEDALSLSAGVDRFEKVFARAVAIRTASRSAT